MVVRQDAAFQDDADAPHRRFDGDIGRVDFQRMDLRCVEGNVTLIEPALPGIVLRLDQRPRQQLPRRERRLARQQRRRAIGLDHFLEQRPGLPLPSAGVAVANGNVECLGVALDRGRRHDVRLDVGMGRDESRKLRHQPLGHQRRRHHEAHHAARPIRPVGHGDGRGRPPDLLEGLVERAGVAGGIGRQPDAASQALEETDAEFRFQGANLVADRRPRQIQFCGGGLEAAQPGHGLENGDAPQRER